MTFAEGAFRKRRNEDWDNTFPPGAHWDNAAVSYLQKDHRVDLGAIFRCPDASSAYSYGFNTSLDRLQEPLPLVAEQTVLLFESNGSSRNAAGDRNLTVRPPRHSGANNYVFADGHAKSVKDDTALQWTVSR